jgi:hypothetical protein
MVTTGSTLSVIFDDDLLKTAGERTTSSADGYQAFDRVDPSALHNVGRMSAPGPSRTFADVRKCLPQLSPSEPCLPRGDELPFRLFDALSPPSTHTRPLHRPGREQRPMGVRVRPQRDGFGVLGRENDFDLDQSPGLLEPGCGIPTFGIAAERRSLMAKLLTAPNNPIDPIQT